MKDLENWPDDASVREGAKRVFRPLFNSIQKEKSEAEAFNNDAIVREAETRDFPELVLLSRRVCHTGIHTSIISFDAEALGVRMRDGVIFVATTRSGFIVGASTFLIGKVDAEKCGYEFVIMVSRLFQ